MIQRPSAELTLLVALTLGLIASCASPRAGGSHGALPPVWAVGPDRLLELDPDAKIRIDLLPMYGGMDRSTNPALAQADAELIAKTTAAAGSRAAASERYCALGIQYYLADNYEKAMMRFNQAWLLDESNPNVFHGFAAVHADHRNYIAAGGFIDRALELGLENPVFLVDAAFLLAAREGDLSAERGGPPSNERIAEIRAETEQLFDRAEQTIDEQDRDYLNERRDLTRRMLADEPASR